MRTFRAHPVEFKLWGDSVIVDALMERGSTPDEQWPADRRARPRMTFEIHSDHLVFHPGIIDSFTQVGQWVVSEEDRAVFVVPKDRVMSANLRVVPTIAVKDSVRHPVVSGKWMRRHDTESWYFRLKVDGTGGVTKTGWWNSDSTPVGG